MMSYHARSETERKEVTMVEKTPDHTPINWEIVRSSIVRTLFHQQLKREDQDNDALAPSAPSTDVAPSATNRTLPSAVLVYNRVPKCSSTAMLRLFKQLAEANKFSIVNVHHDNIKNDLRDPKKEVELMETVKNMEKDAVYIRHVWSPDWKRYNLEVN